MLKFIDDVKNYNTISEIVNHLATTENPTENGRKRGDNLETLSTYLIFFYPEAFGLPNIQCVPCVDNFSQGKIKDVQPTLTKLKNYIKSIKLHSGGDKSDITLYEKNGKILHIFSSKYGDNQSDFDIRLITQDFDKQNYSKRGFSAKYYVITSVGKTFVEQKIKRSLTSTTKTIFSDLMKTNAFRIIDFHDLQIAWNIFKYENLQFDGLFERRYGIISKRQLIPYLHQLYLTSKIMSIRDSGCKNAVLAAVPRCGKTYIVFYFIKLLMSRINGLKILFMSTTPNETFKELNTLIQEYKEFDDTVFRVINLQDVKSRASFKDDGRPTLFIISKQTISQKKKITFLKNVLFDLIFCDEWHFGGCSSLAKEIFDVYSKPTTFTLFISGTARKVINIYETPSDQVVYWTTQDNECLANFCDPALKNLAITRYGQSFTQFFISGGLSDERISEQYTKLCPKLQKLWMNFTTPSLIEYHTFMKHNKSEKGWSTKALFMKNATNPFEQRKIQKSFLTDIFGKWVKSGSNWSIEDSKYPMRYIHRRIQEQNEGSKTIIILFTLPITDDGIFQTTNDIIKIIEDNDIFPVGKCVAINSQESKDAVTCVENAYFKAENAGIQYLVCFIHKQLTMSVTLTECDLLIRTDDWNDESDISEQVEARVQSSDLNRGSSYKKYGFVLDANCNRFSSHVVFQSTQNTHGLGQNIKNMYANVFPLQNEIDETILNIIKLIGSKGTVTNNYYKLKKIDFLMSSSEKSRFKSLFMPTLKKTKDKVKSGIEIENTDSISSASSSTKTSPSKEQVHIDFDLTRDVLTFLIPIYVFFGVRSLDTTFIGIHNFILSNEQLKNNVSYLFGIWWRTTQDMNNVIIEIYTTFLKNNNDFNLCFEGMIIGLKNISDIEFLSEWIDIHLIVHENEKKTNAEVSTPKKLRGDMLDSFEHIDKNELSLIPSSFWESPKKVCDPCVGKGGFIIDIIQRFMIGLVKLIPDENIRYKTIIEECIYFADINPFNIYICEILLNPMSKYKLNSYTGDSLKLDKKNGWYDFDLVIMNPPYNTSGNTGTGNTLWQDFVKTALKSWIKQDGYLLCVHPPGWRKPNTERGRFFKMFELLTHQNQLIYLEIHGVKDGMKTFNCGTRYDWYLLKKCNSSIETIIVDENRVKIHLDLKHYKWLPNSNILEINNLLAKDGDKKCPIIQSMSAYEPRKKWMSNLQTIEFKYPCVHSTPKNGTRYMYSKVNDKGHFGIPKVIFGESGIYKPVIDMEGKYGMTHGAMAIKVDNLEEATIICKVITGNEFDKIIQSCIFSSFRIDWNIFKEFKYDFWKYFIIDE